MKKLKKYFLLDIFFWSSSAEDNLWKTTWQIISLSWCLCYLNITFTFTPLSSNCSIYHCPKTSSIIIILLWQSYLLSCAFGQLIMHCRVYVLIVFCLEWQMSNFKFCQHFEKLNFEKLNFENWILKWRKQYIVWVELIEGSNTLYMSWVNWRKQKYSNWKYYYYFILFYFLDSDFSV